jgi:hypothetical protein
LHVWSVSGGEKTIFKIETWIRILQDDKSGNTWTKRKNDLKDMFTREESTKLQFPALIQFTFD